MKVKLGLLLMIVGACSQAKAEPVHYACYKADEAGQPEQTLTHYMVVETDTGQFILFDETGKYINTAHWQHNPAFNDKKHYSTNINNISLFLNQEGEGVWSLVFFKESIGVAAKSYCF
jgi:hypothetical protein